MPLISDRKSPLTIQLSATGVRRLKALKARLGYRLTGSLLTAVRVCSMAHGCGNSAPLFIQQSDGQFDQLWMRNCKRVKPDSHDTQAVVLMCTPIEQTAFRRCGFKAGSQLIGAETALAFIEQLFVDDAPRIFEKRGSVYYPLLSQLKS